MSKLRTKKSKKKPSRRLQASLLAATLLAVSAPGLTQAADAAVPAYSDQAAMDAALQAALQKASEIGFIKGDAKGQFRPQDSLTRQELALLLTRALKLPAADTSTQAAVDAVQSAGLMQGDSSGFRAGQAISRQELAAVLVRVMDGLHISGGNDVSDGAAAGSSQWAAQYVESALRLGLLPQQNGSFNPKGQVQRQDVLSVMLDLFEPRQETKTITRIGGDVIVLDGVPHIATDKWKKLLGENNAEALEGAVIQYNTLTRDINELGELTIVKSGTADKPLELHADDTVLGGVLTISGDNVSVKGNAGTKLGQVVVQAGVSTVQIDTPVDKLVVQSDKAVKIVGSGVIGELALGQSKAMVTLDEKMTIDDLTLPEGKKPSDLVTNYKDETSVKVNGVPPVKPVSTTPSKTVNRSPVSTSVDTFTLKKSDGPLSVALSTLFTDPDKDQLTFTVTSLVQPDSVSVQTYAPPADVAIEGGNLIITPNRGGTVQFSLTVSDGHNAPVSKVYSVTVTANRAPEFVMPIVPGWSVTTGSQPTRIAMSTLFTDPDNDTLTYTVNTLNQVIVPNPNYSPSNTGSVTTSSPIPLTDPATVAIDNGDLVITPVHAGTMTVSILANDGEYNAASLYTITVTDTPGVNHAPQVSVVINPGDISWTADTSDLLPTTVPLFLYFYDQDLGDLLTYDIVDTAVVGKNSTSTGGDFSAFGALYPADVTVVNGTQLQIVPQRGGEMDVTIRATDMGQLTAQQTFRIKITANSAPFVKDGVPAEVKWKLSRWEGSASVDLSAYFDDADIIDGDELTFTAAPTVLAGSAPVTIANNPIAPADVTISGSTMTAVVNDTGVMGLTITATDKKGATASQTIIVSVSNTAPDFTQIGNPQAPVDLGTYTVSDVIPALEAADYFQESDKGDALTYTLDVSGLPLPQQQDISLDAQTGEVNITANSAGLMSFTVTATDKGGDSVTQTFTLNVQAPSASNGGGIPG